MFSFATKITTCAAILLIACSRDQASNGGPGHVDLAVADSHAASRDLSSVGGSRVLGGDYYLVQPTTDDFVPALKPFAGVVAVSLLSGVEQTVGDNLLKGFVRGRVYFHWQSGQGPAAETASPLILWTPETGSHLVATHSLPGVGHASEDGSAVYYMANAKDDGTSTDLVVSRPDGSRAIHFAQVRLADDCVPSATFVGNLLLALYCANTGAADGGPSGLTLVKVDPTTGVTTILRTGLAATPFWFDAPTRRILVADIDGRGWTVSIDDGAAIEVGADVDDGYIVSSTAEVVHRTPQGALRRVGRVGVPDATVVKSGVQALFLWHDEIRPSRVGPLEDQAPVISPDWRMLALSLGRQRFPGCFQMALGSVDGAGAMTPIQSVLSGYPLTFGARNDFYYLSDCEISHGPVVGTLNVVSPHGQISQLGSGSTFAYSLDGSLVVYSTSYRPAGRYWGKADILLADRESAAPPVVIARGAEVAFFLTSDRTRIVYSLTESADSGIYVYEIHR